MNSWKTGNRVAFILHILYCEKSSPLVVKSVFSDIIRELKNVDLSLNISGRNEIAEIQILNKSRTKTMY